MNAPDPAPRDRFPYSPAYGTAAPVVNRLKLARWLLFTRAGRIVLVLILAAVAAGMLWRAYG